MDITSRYEWVVKFPCEYDPSKWQAFDSDDLELAEPCEYPQDYDGEHDHDACGDAKLIDCSRCLNIATPGDLGCAECGVVFCRDCPDTAHPGHHRCLEDEPDDDEARNTAALAWLNGRATAITILDNEGAPVVLWDPEDAVSIEDRILSFCEKHAIDMRAEAGC